MTRPAEKSESDQLAEATALLKEIRACGAQLHRQGDRLRFSGPKTVAEAIDVERLKRLKPAILHLLQNENAPRAKSLTNGKVRHPLGVVQARMWGHGEIESETLLYNLPAAWWLNGPLDGDRFQQAFAAVVAPA